MQYKAVVRDMWRDVTFVWSDVTFVWSCFPVTEAARQAEAAKDGEVPKLPPLPGQRLLRLVTSPQLLGACQSHAPALCLRQLSPLGKYLAQVFNFKYSYILCIVALIVSTYF